MERSTSIDILLVNQHAEEIKLATLSFRDFFPGCRVEALYRIEDVLHRAQHLPWRLILLDEQLLTSHPTSLLPEIKRLAPFATLILQSERRVRTTALDALHTDADFLLDKRSPTFLTELILYAKQMFEKQDAGQVLEQLRGRHNHLIESLTDVLYELDSEGRFAYLSPSVTTMLGYAPEELVGTLYSRIIAPDQLDQARHRFDDRRTGARASRNIHIELSPKSHPHQRDTVRIKAELSAKGLYDSQHQHLGTRGLLRNISNQRDQEETIRRLTRQLQQSNQLTAAAQHLAGLSKALETPQTGLLTQSQQLLDTIQNIRLIERVETLARYAEEATRLGEAITRASADPAIHRQTVNDLIDSVLASPPLTLTDGHHIERKYAQELPPFTGPHDATVQLLRILLSQALRYTMVAPTHRRLVIKTSAVFQDDHDLSTNTSPLPSTTPIELEIRIEESNGTVIGENPLPLETGDLFEAYALLQQLGGRLDFLAPSRGRLSITIRLPVERTSVETALSPPPNTPVHPVATPVVIPIPTPRLPDRRSSPRTLVQYPAHISFGDTTHIGNLICLGLGGMELMMDHLPSSIEDQHAYVLFNTDDAIVELQAVAHDRSASLMQSQAKPLRSRIALKVSPPLSDIDRNTLSTLLTNAQAHTRPMTVEILLTSDASDPLDTDVTKNTPPSTDYRETLRVQVKLPVQIHARPGATVPSSLIGLVTNLSRGGACLQLDHPPGIPGDRVTLRLSVSGQLSHTYSQKLRSDQIILSASIVWIEKAHSVEPLATAEPVPSCWSVGLRFIQLTQVEEREIRRILAQHIHSSANVEHLFDSSSLVHASWECRNDRQQVIAVTDTHLRHQITSNDPIVLIVSGYGRTQPDYLPLACYLASNYFRVLRYDHTNHMGLSDGEITNTSLGRMHTDLQSLLLFATTTWPTAAITVIAEDVAARVALRTLALSHTADRLLLVNPLLDIEAALFSTYGQDVVGDVQRGLKNGITNLWGLNVDLDSFISEALTGRYSDWPTAAADFTAVSPTPITLTTPERFRPAHQRGFSMETRLLLSKSPIIELMGPISGQLPLKYKNQAEVFHSIVRQLSPNHHEPPPQTVLSLPQSSISHRLLAENERIRIRHHVSQTERETLRTAYLTQLPQLQQVPPYGMVLTELYQHLLPITSGMTVLDIGCEQSDFSTTFVTNHSYAVRYHGRATDNPIHYIGLSQSHDALATTQQQLHTCLNQLITSVSPTRTAPQPVRTTWIVNDWDMALPFDDHSIDRILLHLSIPFIRSPLHCLREAVRVLRHDGMMVVTSFRPQTDLTALIRHHIHATGQNEFDSHAQGMLLLLGRLHEAIRHGILHSYDPEGFKSLCIQAGGHPRRILSILENQLLLTVIHKHRTQ